MVMKNEDKKRKMESYREKTAKIKFYFLIVILLFFSCLI